MSWSPTFLEALSRGDATRRHRIKTLPPPAGVTDPGLDWEITAQESQIGVVIAETGGTTTGALLQVPSWQSSLGGWSVDLVGDATPLLGRPWKGQHVAHEVSLDGGAWEPVQLGIVDDIRGRDTGEWELVCRDGLAALESRYTTFQREQALFALYGLAEDATDVFTGASAFLDEQYDPGNEASLSVSSNTQNPGLPGVPMSLVGDTGGGRLAVIKPESANRFFYRYTGMTGTTTLTTGTDNVYGTQARVRAAGTIIQTVCFIEGHPFDIIRKILCSTGNTSDLTSAPNNGEWDTLPRTWGFGIPHHLIDHEDIETFKRFTSPASGSDAWAMITELQQPDALGFLQAFLNPAGMFLTMRQGRYTVRGVVDPSGMADALDNSAFSFGRLDGAWVVPGSLRWSAWGGSGSREYREIRVQTANGNNALESTIRSHPSEWSYPVNLSTAIWTNEYAQRLLTLARLAPWVLTLCEKLEVEVTHPLARGLAVGDPILLDFRHWGGRDVAATGNYDGRVALVCAVDPDWWHDRPTRLVLATPPPAWWNQ